MGARNQSLKSDTGRKGNPKSKTVHDVPSPMRENEKEEGGTENGPKQSGTSSPRNDKKDENDILQEKAEEQKRDEAALLVPRAEEGEKSKENLEKSPSPNPEGANYEEPSSSSPVQN